MKNVKYRVWNKKKKRMDNVKAIFFPGYGKNRTIKARVDTWNGMCWECAETPVKLMQYIGLKDINGKEIFEGDIVRWDDESDGKWWRVAIVEINPDIVFKIVRIKCNFKQSSTEGYVFRYGSFIYTDTENFLEIIGNVYKDKKLIK